MTKQRIVAGGSRDIGPLQRVWVEDAGAGHAGVEGVGKPLAGKRIAMGEDHRTRRAGDREIEQLVAIGVGTQVKTLDLGRDGDGAVQRRKTEWLAVGRGEQLAAGRIGVAITDKTEGVEWVAEQTCGGIPRRRVLGKHTGAEQIDGGASALKTMGRRQLLRAQLAQNRAANTQGGVDAGNLVKLIEQIDAEAGKKDGAFGQQALAACADQRDQQLLNASERERGDKDGTAGVECGAQAGKQALDFGIAALRGRALGQAAGGLNDQGIDNAGGKTRAIEHCGIGKQNIAGDENLAVPIFKQNADSSGNVPGGKQGKSDTIAGIGLKNAWDADGGGQDAPRAAGDIAMRIQLGGAEALLAAPVHDITRIVQQPLKQRKRIAAGDDGRVRVLGDQERQGTEVIEVGVRQKNQIDLHVGDLVQSGEGGVPGFLGVKPCIDDKGKVADTQRHAIGPDTAVGIEINDIHSKTCGCFRSGGLLQARFTGCAQTRRIKRSAGQNKDFAVESRDRWGLK